MNHTLLQITQLFGSLSLLSFGGGNSVIPAMQHAAVDDHRWMTARQFVDVFALSRAAPGPGSMIALLIGEKAAGLTGALVAGLSFYTPTCLLVYLATRSWRRFEHTAWRQTVERALAPIAIGLIFASGLALMHGIATGLLPWIITLVATVILAFTRLNPLLVLSASILPPLLAAHI
jgi:chromate transporter